jgi:GT2 family glycosyltransferase
MHRELAAASQPRRVLAVTGACLLVAKADFLRVGGFDEGYVQGDYEDLDLCHRLTAIGLQNWYEPGVELYHFEGTSYPTAQRVINTLYNRWRHSQLWGGTIARRANEKIAGARVVDSQRDGNGPTRRLHSGDDVAGSASPPAASGCAPVEGHVL